MCNPSREKITTNRCTAGNLEYPPQQDTTQDYQGRNADKSEFLGNYSDEKIVVGMRQVKKFLDARSQPYPQPFATADRNQGLHQLITTACRVGPRILKTEESLKSVVRHVDQCCQHRKHCDQNAAQVEELVEQVAQAPARGGRVVAVGTTALRALEAASQSGALMAGQGETDIFIYPGYRFRLVDCLVTNFHLPKSTLLMLISAFAGRERVMAAYQAAIDAQYRFFSYGDAMFIERVEMPPAEGR